MNLLELPIWFPHFRMMLRWIGNPLALLAVFVLIGGHWAVLQTVAWAGMLRDYSESYGLAEGVEKTFSGEHPCKMCLKVEEGQKKEGQKAPLLKVDKKAEVSMVPIRFHFACFSDPAGVWVLSDSAILASYRDAPLSPPPQSVS